MGKAEDGDTAGISREHTLLISASGLVTITGGKWTTYRKMAEDTIDQAATLAGLEERVSVTKTLHLHGFHPTADAFGDLQEYGADAPDIQALIEDNPAYAEPLHPNLAIVRGEIVWAARNEMSRTVEDALARRTRALLFDARASIEVAPVVAALLAEELGHDDSWAAEQVVAYRTLAAGYLMDGVDLPKPNSATATSG